jgi:hypothetical protein
VPTYGSRKTKAREIRKPEDKGEGPKGGHSISSEDLRALRPKYESVKRWVKLRGMGKRV